MDTEALFTYVRQPDAVYGWEERGEQRSGHVTLYELRLTSQTWQGLVWTHQVQIFVPDELTHPDTAVLYNTGFGATPIETEEGRMLAEATGCICVYLYHIPNQPLFDGRGEDELIAYTLVQCIETGDATWPLLFPMVKSVVRAMDAAQEFCRKKLTVLRKFIVSGMSKRGWTSWLTAAADARVCGVMPMVYDNLNLMAQMPHQVAMWGGYSERIHDYTELDLQARMATPEGQLLARMIDPYTFRDRLMMPKLILNGANDYYWATDALNLYWHDLPGENRVLYIPNAGHGLNDSRRLYSTVVAFVRAIASGQSLPAFTWDWFRINPLAKTVGELGSMQALVNSISLAITADASAVEARCWMARSESLDFRPSVWQSAPLAMQMESGKARFDGTVPLPDTGGFAAFGEVVFTQDGHTFTLSTQMHITDRRQQNDLA